MNKKAGFLALILTVFTLGLLGGAVKAAMSLNQPDPAVVQAESQTTQVAISGPTVAQPTEEMPTQPVPTATQPVISPDEAATAALQAAGDGEELASQPELVMFNGETAYEVKMRDGSSLYIGAYDSTLKYNSITSSDKPVINSQQALTIAADYINYYQPVSIALKNYNNQVAYYIRFWNGANVYVDRAGNILAIQYVQYTASSGGSAAASSSSSSGSSSGGGSSSGESEHEHEDEND
jgi:uncharacterized membrane protein YgcG